MRIMTESRPFGQLARRAALASALTLSLGALSACGENGNGDDLPAICSEERTLSILPGIDALASNSGFAPFQIQISGQISELEAGLDYEWVIDYGDGGTTSDTSSLISAGHGYTEPGDYTIKLTVTDSTCDKTYEFTQNVTVYPRVELTVADVQSTPNNVQVTEQIDVGMRIINISTSPLYVPITVQYLLSSQPSLLWNQIDQQIPLGSTEVTADEEGLVLGAGQQEVFTQSITVPATVPTGTYYVVAVVDPQDVISEEVDDENNNLVVSRSPINVFNGAADNPDLIVEPSLLAVGPTTAFRQLTTIRANGQVLNIGNEPVGFGEPQTTYAVFLHEEQAFDPETATRVFTSDPFDLDNVPPSNMLNIDRLEIALEDPIAIGPDDADLEIYVTICADPDNAVEEGDPNDENNSAEENNCATQETPLLITNVVSEGTDIVLEGFSITPQATFLDGTIEVSMNVANFGTVPTGSFFCSVYLSEDAALSVNEDTRLTNVNFRSLQPNNTAALTRVVAIPGFFDIGAYYVFAACDPSGVVQETFEDNNTIRLDEQLTIAAEAIIDLYITEFEVTPLSLDNGSDLTVNLTIANEGSSGSGPTEVVLRRSLDGDISVEDMIIGRAQVPPVSPSESVDLTIVVEALECGIFEGSYTLAAEVDPLSIVPEINPDNNVVVSETPLVINGDRCQCVGDDYEPNETPVTAASVSTGLYEDLTMCTGGETDYYQVNLTRGQSMTVRVNLQYDGDCSNLDLRLLSPEFQVIPDAVSATASPVEQSDLFLVQEEGLYVIEVKGRGRCDVNRYDMEIMILDPIPGIDLTGSDMVISNTNPALLEEVTLTYSLLNIGSTDAGAHDLTFYLTQDQEIGVEDFVLDTQRRDLHEGALIQRGLTSALAIPRDAVDGDYYVCAVIDSGEAVEEGNEENNVFCSEQITVDTDCFDPFEINDTAEQASQMDAGMYENLTVCNQGRKDFYRFCAESGNEVEVSVNFVHEDGDIDLRLFEEQSEGAPQVVGTSSGTSDTESVGVEYVAGARCYIAEVLLNDDSDEVRSNAYTMNIRVEPGDPALACDDHFEPNDTFVSAVETGANLLNVINGVDEMGNPVPQVMDRCPENDLDYYYLDLRAGPTIELCAFNDESNPQDYNLNLILYGPGANSPQQLAAQLGTNPCVSRRITVDGRYYVRVRVGDPDRRAVRYGFTLSGLFGTDLTARNLTLEPLDIVPGETFLIYSFNVQNALTDAVESFNYGIYYSEDPIIDPSEDLLLELRQAEGISGLADRTEQGVLLVPEDEAYRRGAGYIGIYLDPEEQIEEENEGNNFLQRQANFVVCNEDQFFGNQTRATGANIEVNTLYEDLSVCPNTTDWFCVEGLEPGEYSANATFALASANDLDTDLNLEVVTVDQDRNLVGLLGRDLDIANNASVPFTLEETSNICLRVFPVRSSGSNAYSLIIDAPGLVDMGDMDMGTDDMGADDMGADDMGADDMAEADMPEGDMAMDDMTMDDMVEGDMVDGDMVDGDMTDPDMADPDMTDPDMPESDMGM